MSTVASFHRITDFFYICTVSFDTSSMCLNFYSDLSHNGNQIWNSLVFQMSGRQGFGFFVILKKGTGLVRWLRGQEHWRLSRRSWVQIPATTWWLTTIHNEIWHPLLVCLKTTTEYLDIIINKSLGWSKQRSWNQFPVTTWWLTTICPTTMYSHAYNKEINPLKKRR